MRRSTRAVLPLLLAGLMASFAEAQNPPRAPTAPRAPARPSQSYGEASPGDSSVLRHNPWPYKPSNRDYGYRNPGGVGRHAEYYPPGDKFQNDSPKHITAQIGNGGQPDRAEQIAAFNAGTQRYNALQSHIDRYGHPFGFGYGFGMGSGFGWPY